MAAINLPRQMLVGGGSVKQIVNVLRSLNVSKPLIVTDSFLASSSSGALDALSTAMDDYKYDVFEDTIPDPTTDSVGRLVLKLKEGQFDSIIALGGGSPMDTAKAASCLYTFGGKMRDYKAPREMNDQGLPLIAIPTTAGTGSEATRFTIVTDTETSEKMLCVGLTFLPVAAIVDYTLTMKKPWRLTADTGIDAMCHAMETYVSKKRNPFADSMALSSLNAIGSSIRTACLEPENHQAREKMMLASTQAGIAFSNASVTLIHGMSRPIGANFHVPHGLSNAMLAPLCTRYSVEGSVDRYADVARAMGFCDVGVSNEDAADRLPEALKELNTELKVPSLREFGVEESEFRNSTKKMAEDAISSGSPNNNPVIPGVQDIENLYDEIYSTTNL